MSTVIFLIILAVFAAAYFIYGNFLSRFLGIDPKRKTPAYTHYDGVDYIPAKNWLILFGHHFASIAGAGPIVGPVFAYMYWGWFGALLWIIFGSIFIGAVHDFTALFVSVREGGVSIGDIAKKYISKRASVVFLIFLWLALILVNAVFAALCAKSFIDEPKIVIPSLGLIPFAMLIGLLLYNLKSNTILTTILGLCGLAYLVVLGNQIPFGLTANAYFIWVIVLFVYCFFASVLPVNILLQPRDYLSSFLLFFGVIVAFFGIIIKPLPISHAQAFRFSSGEGTLFPLMFITVACGAISGFHSLVSSGTTSKQLASEKDMQKIGYGAMIVEAVVAVLALLCVAFGLKSIPQGKTPVEIFALGFSNVVFFLGDYAKPFAFLLLNTFILTTLDTATRITRYLTQELFRINNKYLATLIVVSASGYLCLTGTWQAIWPVFGASNQLVAALALLVVSSYLIHKKKSCKITFIPALAMFFVTGYALSLQVLEFFRKKNYFLSGVSFVLIVLGIFVFVEFFQMKQSRRYAGT
ncbi:MAG: carbon starvation protein A [Candidatus Omnitrophota bacterium]|nr:carbon starvation protein A [Candidatus Omnitrophota bacterium]